ncbi:cysteine and glycine-rich protein 2-like isoform X1 [Lethenteron reissneri]|uniref:cysteine and glycine-rich protein 2-like isoform X1 n=1 Tax=Lethenteron reissneri TaxID=7753 RepID=UPI002AB77033|nr:cysteine and glycine-rich protein 2-like isoform X1 [Lethenteron reissneri]XP_061420468.1 cysteine and glycine-rich protein 2-like isoform X1 [Lethenteron reissneri]
MSQWGGGAHCGTCGKVVFHAEEVQCDGRSYHRPCFQCLVCHKALETSTVTVHGDEIYCQPCYSRKYGPKGYGFGQGAGALSMDGGGVMAHSSSNNRAKRQGGASVNKLAQRFGGAADACSRCTKPVYAAEKIVGAGKPWHKSCFRCAKCGKGLESTTVTDRNGELYCKGCYAKYFGPKGVGFGQGAGALAHTQ